MWPLSKAGTWSLNQFLPCSFVEDDSDKIAPINIHQQKSLLKNFFWRLWMTGLSVSLLTICHSTLTLNSSSAFAFSSVTYLTRFEWWWLLWVIAMWIKLKKPISVFTHSTEKRYWDQTFNTSHRATGLKVKEQVLLKGMSPRRTKVIHTAVSWHQDLFFVL